MLDQQPNVSVWPVRAQEIPSGLPRSPEGIDSNSEQPHSVSRDHTVMGWSLGTGQVGGMQSPRLKMTGETERDP